MFRPLRELAATPHLPRLLVWSMVARLHVPATTIALTFLVAGWTGSYAAAGAVTGAVVLGMSLAGPARGRAADRRDGFRLLAGWSVLRGLGLGVLAVLPGAWWPVALPIGLGCGLATSPVNQVARAVWSRQRGAARGAAFAAEATLQELIFVVAPVIAASTVAAVDARAATALCGGLALVGPLGFGLALRRADQHRAPSRTPEAGPARSLFHRPGLALLPAAGVLLIAGFSTVDLLVVAWARQVGHPGLAGVVTAVWACGAMTGGLLFGAGSRQPSIPLRAWVVAAGIAAMLPGIAIGSPWLIGGALYLGGLAVAPMFGALNSRIGALAPPGRVAEVFGWWASATTAGVALAGPVGGRLLDAAGLPVTAVAAALLVVAGGGLAMFLPAPRPDATPATTENAEA